MIALSFEGLVTVGAALLVIAAYMAAKARTRRASETLAARRARGGAS